MSKIAKILLSSTIIFALAAFENGFEGNKFISLDKGWKFKIGDNLQFARMDYNDSDWEEINVDKNIEEQGHKDYNGYAWYRIRFYLSSDLKKNAALTDSLIFNLGKIDDFNQVFFNGVFIGENLRNVDKNEIPTKKFKDDSVTYWNKERRYSLPIGDKIIKWDDYNLLAIRVYDWGGPGGIFSGDLKVKMPQLGDYLKLDINKSEFINKGKEYQKNINIKNISGKYKIKGLLKIVLFDNILEKEIYTYNEKLLLNPNDEKNISFSFKKPVQSANLIYSFEFDDYDMPYMEKEGVPYILTPPIKDKPQINGALIYGQRAGKPFLYKIAATGKRPMKFFARNLPRGLMLDEKSGIISGTVENKGSFDVTLIAENEIGRDEKILKIVIGNKLALTPPMGWNSWNCWGLTVSEKKIYDAALAFINLGLADHGWSFINIDDGWEIFGKSDKPKRSASEEILTNEKFPDMKKLADKIHKLGLKLGIYSSPGELTCGGYTGSFGHEKQDAETFAKWGIDYLKYDLCGLRDVMKNQYDPKELIPPYEKMNKALKSIDRDIIYSICEYGNGKVWEWAESVGGNLWRTTGDIWDEWDRMSQIGFGEADKAQYQKPGHWNDPDMLVIGKLGWSENLHNTKLTPDEQYTHISLWALLSAPLLLGCDLTQMDEFTMNLITNDEVIAIDQDRLGVQAVPKIEEKNILVWVKLLEDGGYAVGIFNVGEKTKGYDLNLKKIFNANKVLIRDVWRQKDLGIFKDSFKCKIASHGVILLKVIGK